MLAKHMRKRLKKEGIFKGIKAVYSTEVQRIDSLKETDGTNFKRSYYGTISLYASCLWIAGCSYCD